MMWFKHSRADAPESGTGSLAMLQIVTPAGGAWRGGVPCRELRHGPGRGGDHAG